MSAVFEVNILYRRNISLFDIVSVFEYNNVSYTIDSIEVIDNWKYENHRTFKIDEFRYVENTVLQGEIAIIRGILNYVHDFGIYFSIIERNVFNITIWISTKEIEMLDSDYVTEANSYIYNIITEKLITTFDKQSLILCGIGSEIVMDVNKSDQDIVNSSKNICEWIFPCDKPFSELKQYKKTILNDFSVYYLYT